MRVKKKQASKENDEFALIEKAWRDPDAFAVIYQQYLTSVYRYVLSRLNNIHDAEDITAQVFIEALEGLSGFHFQKGKSFAAWLFTITRRRVADFYRRQPPASLDDPPSSEPELASVIESRENLHKLDELLQHLDGPRLELLRLRFSAGLSFSEIGLLENRSEAAVKMAFYRTLDFLRTHWEDENGL